MSYRLFEQFENGNYVSQENLKLIENFICRNLNGWSANKSYYYTQWNYFIKRFVYGERKTVFLLLLKKEKQFVEEN